MAGALPPELVEAVKAVFGGVGLMILFAAWGLYRHFTQTQRDREGRLDKGFSALDESRDREIKRLNAEIDAIRKRGAEEIEAVRRRAAEDLAACERANARKQIEIERLTADRDRGWNLVRELDERLHAMRHAANNAIMSAWIAGRQDAPMPGHMPPIPPVSEMTGKPLPGQE